MSVKTFLKHVLHLKPYTRKIAKIGDISVWSVNGKYVRTFLDEEFTNFGQHYRFPFIPKNEFWIDNEHSNDESRFYIDHLLLENRLMKEHIGYDNALVKADKKELSERRKSTFYKKSFKKKHITSQEIIKKIHKRLIKKYSTGLSVWIINGELVRDKFFIDFTEGGHDKVYHFVPKNEIWLDNDLSIREMPYVLLHEIHERNLMAKGWNYNKAHQSSSKIEYYCRHHPKKLTKCLAKELKRAKLN